MPHAKQRVHYQDLLRSPCPLVLSNLSSGLMRSSFQATYPSDNDRHACGDRCREYTNNHRGAMSSDRAHANDARVSRNAGVADVDIVIARGEIEPAAEANATLLLPVVLLKSALDLKPGIGSCRVRCIPG